MRRPCSWLPLLAAAFLPALASGQAGVQIVPTPRAERIAVSPTNRPFLAAAAAALPVDLARAGYTEEEFQLSGLANVYEWGATPADPVTVRDSGVPYVTRMLVRRPSDERKFSGRVIVELLNPTGLHDIAPLWGLSYAHFMRRGDVWVGLTIKPAAVVALQRFDPVRYGALSFAFTQAAGCTTAQQSIGAPGFDDGRANPPDAENGLAWDIIAQAGALLRSSSKENPLLLYPAQHFVAAGYSQSGGYVVTYANALHSRLRLGGGGPVYDAYFNGAGRQGNVPINQCAAPLPEDDPRRAVMPREVPFVAVMTQTEFNAQPALRHEDSDERGREYRLYEVPGSAHSAPAAAGQPSARDLEIAGFPTDGESRCVEDRNDYPLGLVFNAVWDQLHERLATGTPMTREPRIETDAAGNALTDDIGNALGGWRMPQVDAPLAVYTGTSTPRARDAASLFACSLTGSRRALTPGELKARYRDRNGYLRQFNEALDAALAGRRLTREDAAEQRAAAARTIPAF